MRFMASPSLSRFHQYLQKLNLLRTRHSRVIKNPGWISMHMILMNLMEWVLNFLAALRKWKEWSKPINLINSKLVSIICRAPNPRKKHEEMSKIIDTLDLSMPKLAEDRFSAATNHIPTEKILTNDFLDELGLEKEKSTVFECDVSELNEYNL